MDLIKIVCLSDHAKQVLEKTLKDYNIPSVTLGDACIVESCPNLWVSNELYIGYDATIEVQPLSSYDYEYYNQHCIKS